jgi:hypothetical protein
VHGGQPLAVATRSHKTFTQGVFLPRHELSFALRGAGLSVVALALWGCGGNSGEVSNAADGATDGTLGDSALSGSSSSGSSSSGSGPGSAGTGSSSGTVMSMPLDGGTATALASGQDGPLGIAVDSTSVYSTDYGGGTVMKVPLGGGSATTLACGQNAPVGIAVDSTNVYWTNEGSGTVMKVVKN